LEKEQGSKRGDVYPLQASCQQSRHGKRDNEYRNRDHESQWRFATGDDVRGQNDEIASDVGGEQATEPEKADHVHAAGGQAEHRGQKLRSK
jgi:hypothetical protein